MHKMRWEVMLQGKHVVMDDSALRQKAGEPTHVRSIPCQHVSSQHIGTYQEHVNKLFV